MNANDGDLGDAIIVLERTRDRGLGFSPHRHRLQAVPKNPSGVPLPHRNRRRFTPFCVFQLRTLPQPCPAQFRDEHSD